MDKQRKSENVTGAQRLRSASWQPNSTLSQIGESSIKGDGKPLKLKVKNGKIKKDRCIELYERPRTPHFCTDKRHSHGSAVPMSTARTKDTTRKTDGLPKPSGNRTKDGVPRKGKGSLIVNRKPTTFDNKCVGTAEITDLFTDSVTSSSKITTKTYKNVHVDTVDLISFSSGGPANREDFAVAANTVYTKPQEPSVVKKMTARALKVPDEEAGYPGPLPSRKSRAEIYIPEDFRQLEKRVEQASDNLLDSFEDLLEFLLKDLTTNVAKVRAIFRWCQSQNLTFATKSDPCNIDKPRGFLNCIRQRMASLPELFAILCRKAAIPCVIIHGRSKGTGYDVGDKVTYQTGHTTWNAVFLESGWYFVQPRCTGNTMNSYTIGHWVLVESDQFYSRGQLKTCDDSNKTTFYFLTDPDKFITRFFPEKPEWQLLEKPLTKTEFENLPFLQPAFYELELSVKSHPGCVVETSQGRVVIKLGMPDKRRYHFGYKLYSLRDLYSEGEHYAMLLQRCILHYFCAGDAVFDLRFPTIGIYKLELYCQDQEKALNSDWICDYKILCSDVMPYFRPLPIVPSIGWGPGTALSEAGLKCLSHNGAVVYQHHDDETCFRLVSLKGDTVDVVATLLSCNRSANELKHKVLIQSEENEVILKVTLPDEGEYALQIFVKDAQDNSNNVCNFLLLRENVTVTEVVAGTESSKMEGQAADCQSDLGTCASKSLRQINQYSSAAHEEGTYASPEAASTDIRKTAYHTQTVTDDFYQVDKDEKIHATSTPIKVIERQMVEELSKHPMALKQVSVKSADDICLTLQHQKISAHQIPSLEEMEKDVLLTLDFNTTQRTAELESLQVDSNAADCRSDVKPSASQPLRQIDSDAADCRSDVKPSAPQPLRQIDSDAADCRSDVKPSAPQPLRQIDSDAADCRSDVKPSAPQPLRQIDSDAADCLFDVKPSAPQPLRQIDSDVSQGASQEENSFFDSKTANINMDESTYQNEKDSTDFQQADNAKGTTTTIKITKSPVREEPATAFELFSGKCAEERYPALQPHKAIADQIPSLEKLDNEVHTTMDNQYTQVAKGDHSSLRDLVWDLVVSKNITNELDICRTIYRWLATKDLNAMSFVNVLPGSPEEVFKEIKTDKTTYAKIFDTLCSYAGLHSKVIHGYFKGYDYRLGQKFVPDSNRGSWNAVYINGTWCLVDVDWGARARVSKEELHYRLDEYFFLPDPAQLIYSHFPDDPEWQLLEQQITLEEFENMPCMKTTFFKYGLSLLNRKTIAVCCHDDIVIKIGYPVDKMIELSFDIELETGEKEYESKIKINRYGMLESIEGVALLRLRLPQKGSYKLSIFVRENTSVNEDTLSELVCEFKIVQKVVKSVEPEPFPSCEGHSWGLRGEFFRHGLSTSHQTAIVLTRDRKAQLQFTLPKLMKFKSIMKSNKVSDSELESYCQIRIVDKTAYFDIATPGPGEYGLEIYASDPAMQETSMFEVAQYLIKCKEYVNTVQVRKPFEGKLGPRPKFFELWLHTLSHPDPVIRLENNSVKIVLTTRQEMRVKAELINVDTENDISNYVLVENKVYLITFVVSLPAVGLYRFLLYANYASNTSQQLHYVYNYSINCKKITQQLFPVLDK